MLPNEVRRYAHAISACRYGTLINTKLAASTQYLLLSIDDISTSLKRGFWPLQRAHFTVIQGETVASYEPG
jgi:hypothetical protein